jgi:hypothetical protein
VGRASAVLLVGLAVSGACNQPPGVNPWRDDSLPQSTFGTATSETILAEGKAPAVRQRDIPETYPPRVSREVAHYPLWWEDPFEDQGDKNLEFAWTWQDYLHMPYGFGRFIVNTVGWPVSAVVTPPGTPMVSDGMVETVHDARRGVSPDPVAGPQDFNQDLNAGSVPPPAPASRPVG